MREFKFHITSHELYNEGINGKWIDLSDFDDFDDLKNYVDELLNDLHDKNDIIKKHHIKIADCSIDTSDTEDFDISKSLADWLTEMINTGNKKGYYDDLYKLQDISLSCFNKFCYIVEYLNYECEYAVENMENVLMQSRENLLDEFKDKFDIEDTVMCYLDEEKVLNRYYGCNYTKVGDYYYYYFK